MERIDLFVKVMSPKETSPLPFLEDLIKEGSDFTRAHSLGKTGAQASQSQLRPAQQQRLGRSPGSHVVEEKTQLQLTVL